MDNDYNLQNYAGLTRIGDIPFLFDSHSFILIVEGFSDKKLYDRLFKNIFIFPANGKTEVRHMLHLVPAKYKGRCKALVDRDYDVLLHRAPSSDQIIYTDAHSLETQMWMIDEQDCDMLPGIVYQLIDRRTIDAVKSILPHIYDAAYNTAYSIGLLRLADQKERWNINFNKYQITREMFVPNTDTLNIQSFINTLIAGTDNEEDYDDICDTVNALVPRKINRWEIMQGHDISSAFVFFIKQYCTFFPADWDGWDDPTIARDDFQSKAIGACNMTNLRNASFYQTIRKWCMAE